MDVERLIKESHDNAVDKKFYICGECSQEKEEKAFYDKTVDCPTCKGTGKYRDIGELLGLIMSEFGEAINAWRKNRHANIVRYLIGKRVCMNQGDCFYAYIKGTFEDEMADIFIRLFDLCGYLEISPLSQEEGDRMVSKIDNVIGRLHAIATFLPPLYGGNVSVYIERYIHEFYACLLSFCTDHNIDIETHIRLKTAYNKTRPEKHGGKC